MSTSGRRADGPAWIVRPERPGDAAAIADVHRRAFGGRASEARLVEAIRASDDFVPSLSLVAEAGGAVVGHVLLSRLTLQDGPIEHAALVLAPVGVRPEWQRRGVGSALVRRGAAVARAAGHRLVVLLGAPAYYRRFGFEPSAAHGITQPFPAGDASMVLFLEPGARGAVRGTVVYRPAFSSVPGVLPT